MNTDQESAIHALQEARRAIQQGNRRAARRWAEIAAATSRGSEEPWLLLAAIASPRASIAYLDQALKINPGSLRARKGMHWAAARLREETRKQGGIPSGEESDNKVGSPIPKINAKVESVRAGKTSSLLERPTIKPPSSGKSTRFQRVLFSGILVIFLCIILVWFFRPADAARTMAAVFPETPTTVFEAPIDIRKPTYTPTHTPTQTPTNTPSPTPTFTATFTPTPTATSTSTPLPTWTTESSPTPRPWATNTPAALDNRWIDVDLSQQMVYAYEGSNIVASFLVSTGVSAFPTVTGQFHIYIKLVSTLMYGDGYYLPDVPYTMYFYKGYGLHGTYWHSNFGQPMSHGCVNMYTPDAEWLFYWASVGTLVNVHY